MIFHLVSLFLITGSPYHGEKSKKELTNFNNYWPRSDHFSLFFDSFRFYDLEMTLNDPEINFYILPGCSSRGDKQTIKSSSKSDSSLIFCDNKSKSTMDRNSKTQAWAALVLRV